MLPILRIINCSGKGDLEFAKSPTICCLKLRQWAIICSIIVLILTAVLTTCSFLGFIHTKEIYDLLEEDIQRERERELGEMNPQDSGMISSNEAKLLQSKDFVDMYNKMLKSCSWIGSVNLIIDAVMMYGVVTANALLILPWILLKGLTILLGMCAVFLIYMGMVPGLDMNDNLLYLVFLLLLVFVLLWWVIVIYTMQMNYIFLWSKRRPPFSAAAARTNPLHPPTVIHAYGGYTHTISPVVPLVVPTFPDCSPTAPADQNQGDTLPQKC